METINSSNLPVTEIKIIIGFNGLEPKKVVNNNKKYPNGFDRLGICFDTSYHSINGGYYYPYRVLNILTHTLNNCVFFPVLKDCYSSDKLVVKEDMFFDKNEEYFLLENEELIGELFFWELGWSGGGVMYEDKAVIDITIKSSLASLLIKKFESLCKEGGINVNIFRGAKSVT
jgi:hypothetical protein